jgi:AraC family ethanolamine operon transcriptional activator
MHAQIEAHDAEELSTIVAPWVFDMQQISSGKFSAQFNLISVNGILLTRERWSNRVLCLGTSPPGYFSLIGIFDNVPFTWNGIEINSTNLACGLDAPETEALTGDGAEHWVVLIPLDKLRAFMGEESYSAIPRSHRALKCSTVQSQELCRLIMSALAESIAPDNFLNNIPTIHALENELLARVVELLITVGSLKGCQTQRKRYAYFRRAVYNIARGNIPANTAEMALASGASERVLQLAFQENLGISPYRFLRIFQLNRLGRDLRHARYPRETVTESMEKFGFTQFGRTSAEYKQLFGELPSETLNRNFKIPPVRLQDALAD